MKTPSSRFTHGDNAAGWSPNGSRLRSRRRMNEARPFVPPNLFPPSSPAPSEDSDYFFLPNRPTRSSGARRSAIAVETAPQGKRSPLPYVRVFALVAIIAIIVALAANA